MDVYSSIIIIHYFAWQTSKARIAQTLHDVNFENKVFLQLMKIRNLYKKKKSNQ